MTYRTFFASLIFLICVTKVRSQIIVNIGGDGTGIAGYAGDGKLGRYATFSFPLGLALAKDSTIYVADYLNHVIRKIGKDGIVSTIAGTGEPGYTGDGGPASNALLQFPGCLFYDRRGNLLFSDFQVIRKIDANGIISTFAGSGEIGLAGDGGPARSAWFKNPYGITEDKFGNIYIADSYNDRIRRVDTNGIITTYAGSYPGYSGDGGLAADATFYGPSDLSFDNVGNMYIADTRNHVIRRIDTTGIVTTIAGAVSGAGTIGGAGGGWSGDGLPATIARLNYPVCVRADDSGQLYICDALNNRIRMVDASGVMHTIAGSGEKGNCREGTHVRYGKFDMPSAILIAPDRTILFSDRNNHMVRALERETAPVFTQNGPIVGELCSDSDRYLLQAELAAYDPDLLQELTWNILDRPSHGEVVGNAAGFVANNIPVHIDLSYLPERTFAGRDSFSIQLSDGYKADTIVVKIDVALKEAMSCGPVPTSRYITLKGSFGCTTSELQIVLVDIVGRCIVLKKVYT